MRLITDDEGTLGDDGMSAVLLLVLPANTSAVPGFAAAGDDAPLAAAGG
jgi:hypothetical protein